MWEIQRCRECRRNFYVKMLDKGLCMECCREMGIPFRMPPDQFNELKKQSKLRKKGIDPGEHHG